MEADAGNASYVIALEGFALRGGGRGEGGREGSEGFSVQVLARRKEGRKGGREGGREDLLSYPTCSTTSICVFLPWARMTVTTAEYSGRRDSAHTNLPQKAVVPKPVCRTKPWISAVGRKRALMR